MNPFPSIVQLPISLDCLEIDFDPTTSNYIQTNHFLIKKSKLIRKWRHENKCLLSQLVLDRKNMEYLQFCDICNYYHHLLWVEEDHSQSLQINKK